MSSPILSEDPIIIVDDDTDDHFIFQEIAERLQLQNEIRFFRNASEALEYLRTTSEKPFIIFCDINMPAISGLQFRKTINDEEHLRRKSIPFVFFSTSAGKEQVSLAYDLTVQGFFLKAPSFIETERTFKMALEYWDKCIHPNTVK